MSATADKLSFVMATTQMLSIDETASLLSVHPQTVRSMIKRGELAAVKVARHWRISERVLEQITTAPGEAATRSTPTGTPETRAAALLAALDGDDMTRRNAAIVELARADAATSAIVETAAARAVEEWDGEEDDFSQWQNVDLKPHFPEEAPDFLDGLYRADKHTDEANP